MEEQKANQFVENIIRSMREHLNQGWFYIFLAGCIAVFILLLLMGPAAGAG